MFIGRSEIYLSCYNLFWQFFYYRRGNKRLKTVLSMLSCGALEREVTIQSVFSKNQKEIFAVWVRFWMKSWKRLRQWKKVSMSRKRNLCTCVLERKKNNSLEIYVIILRYIRNVISLSYSKSILKLQIFLQKTSFFL